jgi:eukaryotic-like serine/threonine-protein kinase
MTTDTADREPLYGDVTDQILTDLRAGREPDLAAIAQRYPALAGELEDHAAQLAAILQADAPAGTDDMPRRIGDFYLLREVGRGGMGIVYESEHLSTGRRAALKVLTGAALLDPIRRQRFQHEAQAAARLKHPHVVPVFTVNTEGELPYYAMQFIDGPSVAAVIDDRRRQSRNGAPANPEFYRTAARWAAQAAAALHYAHEDGIIHRDVKPANLLVDGTGNIWVADFGLARLRGEVTLTATGDTVGTLRYMSPEQAQGARGVADHRVDIYALGATLYELLTLEPVIAGEDRAEVLRRLLDDDPQPPRSVQPAIPHDLETVVLKAVRKDPAERYATAQEFADDLERVLAGEPVQARRPTSRELARRWARRHAVRLAIAGGVLVLLSAILAASTALTVRAYAEANRNAADAKRNQDEAKRNQDEAKLAQQVAERKQDYAERSRAVARRAVDQVLTGVVRDWLDGDTELEPVQQHLLEQLLACCQELANEDPTDTEARFRVAEARHHAGAILLRLGRYEPALQSQQQALAELASLDPTPAAHRFLRSRCLNSAGGSLYFLGKQAKAEQGLREAIALVDGLRTEDPKNPVYRFHASVLLGNLAFRVRTDPARYAEAFDLYDRAVRVLRELLTEDPNHFRAMSQLSYVRTGQALLHDRLNRPPAAEEAARESVDLARRLVKERPADRQYRDLLASGLFTLAGHLTEVRRDAEALPLAEESVQITADLMADFPASALYREKYGVRLGELVDALIRLGQVPRAEQMAIRSVEIQRPLVKERPHLAKLKVGLADALLRLGYSRDRLKRPREAEPAYREGIDLLLEVLQGDPVFDVSRRNLTRLLPNLRHVQTVTEAFADAAAHQEKVAAQLKQLADRQPTDRYWQHELGRTYRFLGALYLRLGKPAEAEVQYRRQVEVVEQLAKPSPAAEPDATLGLAYLLSECPIKAVRDPIRAYDLARQAFDSMKQKNFNARVVLAAACNGVGKYEETIQVLEPLTKSAPGQAIDCWRHWALAQHHLGRPEQARAGLAKIAQWVKGGGAPLLEHQFQLPELNDLLGDPEPGLRFQK